MVIRNRTNYLNYFFITNEKVLMMATITIATTEQNQSIAEGNQLIISYTFIDMDMTNG